MPMSVSHIKKFLAIQSHERFADLFISESTTKTIIFSKKEMYIYNNEFNYYEPVDIGGRFLKLVSSVLHKAIEEWEQRFLKDFMISMKDEELTK